MPDAGTLNLCYGATDTSLALASGSVQEVLGWLRAHEHPGGFARDLCPRPSASRRRSKVTRCLASVPI